MLKIVNDKTHFLLRAFSSSLIQINISFLQDNVGVTATNTLDCSHSEHDFPVTIDIRAHDTKNVLELLGNYERLESSEGLVSIVACTFEANLNAIQNTFAK